MRADLERRGYLLDESTRAMGMSLARGCQTASLQSTQMAEGVYAAVGFSDLGRILE